MSETKELGAIKPESELAHRIEAECAKFKGKYEASVTKLEQLDKVYGFLCYLVKCEDGEIKCLDVNPESNCASIAIEVPLVDLHKDEMKQFIDILQYVDTFDVKTTVDEALLISVGISNVWEVVG